LLLFLLILFYGLYCFYHSANKYFHRGYYQDYRDNVYGRKMTQNLLKEFVFAVHTSKHIYVSFQVYAG